MSGRQRWEKSGKREIHLEMGINWVTESQRYIFVLPDREDGVC